MVFERFGVVLELFPILSDYEDPNTRISIRKYSLEHNLIVVDVVTAIPAVDAYVVLAEVAALAVVAAIAFDSEVDGDFVLVEILAVDVALADLVVDANRDSPAHVVQVVSAAALNTPDLGAVVDRYIVVAAVRQDLLPVEEPVHFEVPVEALAVTCSAAFLLRQCLIGAALSSAVLVSLGHLECFLGHPSVVHCVQLPLARVVQSVPDLCSPAEILQSDEEHCLLLLMTSWLRPKSLRQ